MPYRRRYRRYAVRTRARRSYGRIRRRIGSAKIPLEMAITGISIPFTPVAPGWPSLYERIKEGNIQESMYVLKKGFLNMDPDGSINFPDLINPFDVNAGKFVKMLLYASLISKVRKRFVKLPMKKIPFIGRYIS